MLFTVSGDNLLRTADQKLLDDRNTQVYTLTPQAIARDWESPKLHLKLQLIW